MASKTVASLAERTAELRDQKRVKSMVDASERSWAEQTVAKTADW